MKKDKKFIEKWEKVRKKGKTNYALTWGLIIGVFASMGSIMGTIIRIWAASETFSFSSREMLIYWNSLGYLGVFIGGFLAGLTGAFYFRWDRNENKYNKIINEQSK
jgi:ABC-type antimicrobial peptide transport system permease subunit